MRRCVLCMIASELFRWSTKLWQLFLLESWAILLTDVVRIREEILPQFQTLWCWIIRRRNASIGSRKSRHRAAYISQPLNPDMAARAGAGAARIILHFEPEIEAGEEAEICKVLFRGAVAGFADDHVDVEQTLGNNDWPVHLSLFLFSIYFWLCYSGEKRFVSTLSYSYTRSLALAPRRPQPAWPVRLCQGLRVWL